MGRRHPVALRNAALDRIRAGRSISQVATETGMPRGTVARLWWTFGDGDLSHRKKPKTSKSRHEKWLADYKRGLTTGQIAIRAGVSRTSVVIALSKMAPDRKLRNLRRSHDK